MSTFIKTITRMLFIASSILLTCILILIIFLIINSPGKTEPFLDNRGKDVAGSMMF